jgi:ribosomal protein S18 acetylase RimI-like enzyme
MPEPLPDTLHLLPARTPDELAAIRSLFLDYQAHLGIDLCFQGFEQELRSLPGDYAEPSGGLFLGMHRGQPAGCCAFRPLVNSDHLNACEMKRLFVRREARGLGLGRLLVDAVVLSAQQAGYTTMLLDTLSDMEAARALYQDIGFTETEPYYHNPLAGAHYLKLDLRGIAPGGP